MDSQNYPYNQGPNYQQPAGPRETDGYSICSMIFGILGLACVLPVLGSLVAIVTGHIGMGRTARGQRDGRGMAIAGLAMGYGGIVIGLASAVIFAGMMLPALSAAREKARRVHDAGNQKQLGLALLMYSGDFDGFFPPDAATLVEGNYIQAGEVWVCPNTDTLPPASAADIRAGQTDYVYVGSGCKDDFADATNHVILHNKPDCFTNWINCLFIDGHVEGFQAESIEDIQQQRGDIKIGPQPSPWDR